MKNKKLLIGILAAIVLIGLIVGAVALFGGQGSNVEPTTTEPQGTVSEADIDGITAALEYLKTVYPVGKEPTQTPRGFQRESIVRIGGVPYTVVWTVDVGEDIVKIVSNEDGIVKFEVNKNLEEDTPYKLTATITDAEGNEVSFTWDMLVPKAVDQLAIVKAAYELAEGESMNEEVTLTGIITAISTPYSADFNNISVIMVVEGGEDYPILCYRLKGEGVDDLDAGDTITVTGIIKNYKGTIEFDAGCMLIEYENTGEEFVLPETTEEILKLAYALKEGEALPVNVTLTGIVTQVNTPYDAGYDNVTVTMVVDGFGQYPIMCYRLKGNGASQIGKGDTITVTGVLKNYYGKIEYDSGCTLDSWEDTGADVPMDYTRTAQLVKDPMTGTAYKLFVKQGNLNKVLYFNGQMNGYYLGTTNNPNEAVDVYLQSYEGGYRMYFVSFGTRYYITLVSSYNASQGKTYINPELSTWSTRVWYYDGEFDTMYTTLDGNDYYLGCYNSFDTMGSSKTSYLGGSSNFPAHFGILVDKDKVVEEEEQDYSAYYKTEIVEAPGAGKPYKFGLTQKGIEGEPVIYFNGKLSNQYYLGGTEDPENAVDVTLKKTKGGYYITYKDASGATQYIIMYQSVDSAGVLRTNVGISDKPSTVFVYDENLKTLVATMEDGERYYIGTYKDYRTFSASNVSYIEGGSNTSFQAHLMTVTAIEGEATLEEAVVQIKKSYPNGYKDDNSLISTFKVRDTEFEVSWKVQTTNKKAVYIKDGKLVTVPQEKPVNFRLIATITKDGESATATWELVVEQIPEDYVETLKTDVPYALGLTQKLLSGAPTLYFDGGTDSSNYRLSTTQKGSKVVPVYVEAAGKNEYRLYFMDGDTKTYIRVYEYTKADGNLGGSLELTTSKPKETFTYDKDLATLVYTSGDNSYFMGTYSTYTTISVSSSYYITGDNAANIDNTQFIARFYPVPEAGEEEEDPSENVQLGYVTKAETGKAYKLGLVQGGLNNTLLMFSGTMSGYYGATTESVSEAVDVYLEKADGGYYLSFKDPYGSKQYINILQNGTYTNFVIAADAQTVYTFDTTYDTLVTELNGETYYIGTYGTFSTLSVSKSSYLTSSTSYPARLYAEGADTVKPEEPKPTEPTVPTEPTKPTAPSVSVGLDSGDKIVIFAPAYNKALSADKVTAGSYYNKGVDVTVSGNKVKGYTDAEVWTVTANSDGSYSFANNGKNIGLGDSFSSMNLGEVHDDWYVISLGGGLYNIQNIGRGNYMEWYSSKDNWSSYNSSYAATDDQFQLSIYVIGEGILEDEPAVTAPSTNPTTPKPTESKPTGSTEPIIDVTDELKTGVAYKLGMDKGDGAVLYFNGQTESESINYRLAVTTDVNEAVDVYLEAAGKNGYRLYFMEGKTKTYIRVYHRIDGDPGYGKGSLELVTGKPSEYFTYNTDADTLVYDYDGNNAYYMGTYSTYTTISVSNTSYITGNNAANVDLTQFPARLYEVTEITPDPTVPSSDPTVPSSDPTVPSSDPTVPSSNPTVPTSEPVVSDGVEVGVAYKLGIDQTNKGAIYYFIGDMKGFYGATSTNWDDGVEVMLEEANGGYYVTFNDASGAKKYITVVQSGTYFNFTIADSASTVYTYDAEYDTLVTVVGEETYYMGTYSNYDTFGFSKYSYISTSFPAHLYEVSQGTPDPTVPSSDPTVPSSDPTVPSSDPTVPSSDPVGSGDYVKVESANEFTSGSYVMIVDSGYAPGMLDGAWLSAVQPVVDGNKVTDTAGAVWTLTVSGDKVVITDANGKSIAPKAANTNGIIEGSYEWTWAFADGKFTFDAVAETVRLASNSTTDPNYGGHNRFRGYKLTTLTGSNASDYFYEFTLYKLDGEGTTEPTDPTTPTTEPTTAPTQPTTAPSEPNYATEVQTGVAYKLGIDQTNKGAIYYFTGDMSGFYGASSENWDDGVEVVLEEANGGYYVTFTDASGAKKYINMVQSGTYNNFTIADSASTVYVFDGEYNTLVTVVGDETYYMGTYNNFVTFGFSKYSYIETSFPAHLYVIDEEVPEETDPVTEPTTETTEPTPSEPTYATEVQTSVAYKLGIDQTNKGAIYYFTGDMSGFYGATSENWDDGVEVVLEEANGGYYVTFTDASGAKKYINMVQSGTYNNFTIADSASTVYVFDGEYNTLVTVVGDETYYMGTYNNFVTFGFSKYSYIETSFPAHLYVIGESEPEATEPEATEPEVTEPEATEPATSEPAGSGAYEKVTDASQFTSGTYVLVVESGYALGALDGTWVLPAEPTVDGDVVTDTAGAVWTLTVTDGTVVLTDANGVSIGPKASNTNGIKEDSHAWTWSFENGVFTFTSADGTVRLASNVTPTSGENRFRAYKLTTLNGNSAANYYSEFTLYKLDGTAAPEATEPTTEETTTAPAGSSEPEVAETIEAGVAYKLGLNQVMNGKVLYFSGTTADKTYRLATTDGVDSAVDVYLEAVANVEGGYRLYFMDGNTKTYIRVYEYTKSDGNLAGSLELTATEPAEYFTFDADLKTLIYTNGENSYYLGTYNTYTTISVSSTYFITGNNAANVDVSQFPAHLYVAGEGNTEATEPATTEPETTVPVTTAPPAPAEPTYVTEVQTGVAYKLGIDQTNKGAIYYFNGDMSGFYGATSTNWDDGVEVVLEAADNGYYVTFNDASGAKKYITVVQSGNYTNFTIADSASTVYTYDAQYNTLVTVMGSETYYMGTYNTYTTFGFSKYSFISTSFPAHLYVMGEGEPEATEPEATEPEATEPETTEPETTVPASSEPTYVTEVQTGVAYKLGIDQTNKGAIYYFNGDMSGFYGATSTNWDDGVEVVLEAADNGYYVTFNDASGAKKYINVVQSGNYTNFTIADSASTVYVFDGKYNTLTTVLGDVTYYMGTYNTYTTFGFSKYSYIETSFPAHLYVMGQSEPEPTEPEPTEPEVTEPEVTEPEATEPTGSGTYVKVTDAAQLTSGTYVLVVESGYALGALDGTWVLPAEPTVEGDAVTDTAGAVWTLTVTDGTVVLTDANGVSIGPKASNTNGIKEDSHAWTWSFENGVFTFTSADGTVRLASNVTPTSGENRFRAYKLTTLNGSSAANYYSEFTLYKLV